MKWVNMYLGGVKGLPSCWIPHNLNDSSRVPHIPMCYSNSTTLYPISIAQSHIVKMSTLGKRYRTKCGAIGNMG